MKLKHKSKTGISKVGRVKITWPRLTIWKGSSEWQMTISSQMDSGLAKGKMVTGSTGRLNIQLEGVLFYSLGKAKLATYSTKTSAVKLGSWEHEDLCKLPRSWEVCVTQKGRTGKSEQISAGWFPWSGIQISISKCKVRLTDFQEHIKHCLQMKWLHNSQPSDMLHKLCLLLPSQPESSLWQCKHLFSCIAHGIAELIHRTKINVAGKKRANWLHDQVPQSDEHECFCWHKEGHNTSMGAGLNDIFGRQRCVWN